MESVLTKSQKREIQRGKHVLHIRYDDECGNGHNTFAMTMDTYETPVYATRRQEARIESCGCQHEEIAKVFPEYAKYIKWHLCSSDGPMHYLANTLYHASNRDHNGLLKGEKRQLRNGRTKQPVWQRVMRNEKGEEVEVGHHDWVDSHEKPTETLTASWEPVWTVGEGKERNLDHARSTAIWPEATDEELLAPDLKEKLVARLPGLLKEFKAAMEELKFVY